MVYRLMFAHRLWVLALVALASAGLIGCGPPLGKTYPVKGKVVYKGGKPVQGGFIELESVADQTLRAVGSPIGEDGSFTLIAFKNGIEQPGVVAGEYKVHVELPRQEKEGARKQESGGGRVTIPGTITVKAGDNPDHVVEVPPKR